MRSLAFTFLFVAAIVTSAKAQFSFEGGVGFDNLALKSDGQKIGTKFATGGAFGILAGLPVGGNIYFEPGLYYKTAGCKFKDDPSAGYTISTVFIPLDLVYKTGNKCGARAFIGVGAFIAQNLSGTYDMNVLGTVQSGDLKIGTGSDANLKATDFGLNLTAGYKLKKHFYGRLRYQMGMTNLLPSGNSDNSIKTSSISITIGYAFGSCRERRGGGLFHSKGGNHWQGLSKGKWSRRSHPPRYPQ